jgi:hypothetical protein
MNSDQNFKPCPLNPILIKDRDGNIRKARITSKEARDILGYSEEEMQHLVKIKHLCANGVVKKSTKDIGYHKWKFSTYYIYKCCQDIDWMNEAEQHLWAMTKDVMSKKGSKKSNGKNRVKPFVISNN